MVDSEIWLNILKSSPVPIAVFELAEKSNSLLFANDAYCGFFGVLEGEIANKSAFEIFLAKSIHLKDDITSVLIKSLQRTVESGEPDKVKNVILRADYPNRAIPETLFFDIEHTPIKEEGVVKYVSQSLLQNKQAPDVSFPDVEKGTEQLRRAELIETILQNLPIGIAVNRIDNGEATLVNRQFSATYGWSEQDLVDVNSFFDKVYPDPLYREKILRRVMEDINSGEESRMAWDNIEVTTSTGEKRLINAKNIPLFDQNLMISTVVDITLQARQADEIRRAKVNQETLINSSKDLIWSVDTDKKIITANKAFLSNLKHATGRDVKEGDSVLDNVYGDNINRKWKEYYDRALSGENYTVKEEYHSLLKNRIEYSVLSFSPMRNEQGEIFGAACYSMDITNDTLAELEKNLLISNTEESFVLINRDLEIVSFNDQFQQLYKNFFNKVVTKGISILDYAQPERRAVVAGIYERVLRGETENSEINVVDPSSKEKRTFSLNYKPAKNSSNEIIGVFVTAADISERKLMLEKMKESEERYKLLFQSNPLPNFVYDLASFQILDVNDSATVHYGYLRSEFLGQTILDIASEDEKKRLTELHKKVILTEQVVNFGIFVQRKKDSELIQSDVSGYKINFAGRDCMMIVCNDVTERENAFLRLKENESKLLASQKIAKVGYWQSFPGSNELYWSDEVYNIWGRDKQTFNLDYDSHFNTIHLEDREEFLRSRDRAFKEGVQHDVEHRIILPDGSIKWVHALGNLIKDDLGEIMIFEGTVQDITKDKLALEKLLVSEARHRGIFESQTNYMIRTDLEGNYSFVNNKFLQDFGWLYENKEIIGQNCLNSILVYHHERVADTVAKCFAELNKVFQVFIDKPRKDGKGVVSTLWDFICLTDAKGQPSEIQCVGIDVSEWKKTQEELEESNLRYEYVTRATSDAIWDWDLRTDEVYYGGSFQTLFGYSVENIEKNSMLWEDHVHPDDLSRVLDTIEAVIKGYVETLKLEYRFEKSDGTYAFIQDKGILIKDKNGTPIKMVGAMQDITNRKSIELELLQFKKIIDNSRDGIAIVDLEGKFAYLNPAFSDAIGFDPLIHNHPESVYANRQLVGQVFDNLLSGKYWKGDVEVKTQAGELISYYLSGGPVFDEEGKLKAVYGIHTDITERKKAEQTIRKAYYERNTILESIGDGFFAVDKSWTVNYWNREAEKLFGVTKKQALGNNLWDVFDHMAKSTSYSKYQEAIDTNQVIHFVDYYPSLHKWYDVSAYPSVDGLSVFFKDITERKIYDIQVRGLNEVLRTKVKELAVSNRELEQFAYVASHDLQEPLRMISSFLTQLQRKYDDQLDAKAHQYIHFAVDGAKRMRQIILDLLDFSRVGRGDSEKELVNLNEVINEILILFRKNIEDTKALFVISDLPSINVPKASIRQLMQNLVSNAMKYQTPENSPLVEIGFTEKPDYWEFWVKDNGIGISSDYFEKIFIIFQRLHTKDQYSGTGMGLAICRKIVENIGGKLWVESEEEKGSTFYFTIPKTTIIVREVLK